MKRIWVIFVSFFVFLNFFALHAREVDRQRLKDFVDMDLEFVNYRGSYDSMDTYEQIVGIGEFLARNLINDKSNYYNKYYVNRYVDEGDERSSSDVFLIGDRSALDSVLNLRRILMGYLMGAFSYSRDSAELLAKAITIYNAVYRGDLDYYGDSYVQPALKDATKDNVGLSRVYSQWAGKTRIFIPLRRDILSGNVGSEVDLDRIVTERVIASLLNENESGGTDFARDITDVQDEIRDIDQERVDIESESLKSIEEELNETIEDLREQLEKATSEDEKGRIQEQIKDKRNERDALEKRGSGLKDSQEKLDEGQDKLDAQRDMVKERLQEDIDDENKDKDLPKPGDIGSPKVDEKDNELKEEARGSRENGSAKGKSDVKKLKNSEMQSRGQTALDQSPGGRSEHKSVFLEVLDPSTNLGVLQFIDSDGNKLEESSQHGIRRYGVYERADDLVVIKLCSGIAKLQLINKAEDLNVESESQFELSRDSSLFVDTKMILVVVKDNNVWKLAKFSSKDLSDFILSEDEVLPFTSFTVSNEFVYLQDAVGKVTALDLGTLKRVP